MDGKTGAEELVAKLLQDPALLQTLATTQEPAGRAAVVNRVNPRAENSHG